MFNIHTETQKSKFILKSSILKNKMFANIDDFIPQIHSKKEVMSLLRNIFFKNKKIKMDFGDWFSKGDKSKKRKRINNFFIDYVYINYPCTLNFISRISLCCCNSILGLCDSKFKKIIVGAKG